MNLERPALQSGDRERKVFIYAAVATVAIVVAFVAWVELRIGGDRVTIAFDDISELAAAFMAAAACGWAARKTSGRQRLGWTLLAASAAVWGTGQVVWSIYEIGSGSVPYPSGADAGFLGAIPLAAAGIVAFFSTPRGTSTRLRLWLDGAIVFLALIFVSWTLGLRIVYQDDGLPALVRTINMAYPVGDILIGTILVLAIRRARNEAHGRLLLLLGGLAANSLADSAFAYLNATGNYGAIGSVLDVGWVGGYLMIGLAALWPSGAGARLTDDRPIDIWQLALPWLALLGVGLSAIVLAVLGHPLDVFQTLLVGALAILVMVSQIYAHSESLSLLIQSRRDAATLNDIILYAPLGVARIGLDMKVIQANPRFAELLHRPEAEIVGAPLTTHLPADEVQHAADEFQLLSAGSVSSIESETEAVRGDGEHIWLHWSATAVRNVDGEVDYYIAMFNDTTARHRAEVAAVANINVLERLNRLKSEFLTMVRHEFRTALVGIEGFSELMRDADWLDVVTVKGFASDIYNDAHRLDGMLGKMLDLDRMEAEKVEIHLVPTDLGAAAGLAVELAKASTKVPIRLNLDLDLPEVLGDAAKLAWLFRILIDNAIRYSPQGGEIIVSTRAEPGQIMVSVKDLGIGMPPDFDDQLFARYQWSADNPTTKVMGTGLGLPMARQIVEMHGGRIWFESTPGAGSEFFFTVPLPTNGAGSHAKRAETVAIAVPV